MSYASVGSFDNRADRRQARIPGRREADVFRRPRSLQEASRFPDGKLLGYEGLEARGGEVRKAAVDQLLKSPGNASAEVGEYV